MDKVKQRLVNDSTIKTLAKGDPNKHQALLGKIRQNNFLRSVRELTETESSYDFSFRRQTSDDQDLNVRLTENDAFIAFGHKVSIIRVPVVLEVSGKITPQWGNAEAPIEYVDPNMFGGSPAEFKALKRIYNARLSYNIEGSGGSKEVVPPIPTNEIRYIPQQQYFARTGSNRGFEGQFGGTDALGDNGFTAFDPDLRLLGSATNTAKLAFLPGTSTGITGAASDIPASGSTAGSGFRNYVCVTLYGLLIKGAGAAELAIDAK